MTHSHWKIKLLYDGQCPLCVREVNFLKAQDQDQGRIAFVDITDLDYDPAEHGGVDFEAAMRRIHAVQPDGTVIQNLEVFRQVYGVLGLGWVYAATQWPVIGTIAESIYSLWASGRLRLTGRPDLATLIEQRQRQLSCDATVPCVVSPPD